MLFKYKSVDKDGAEKEGRIEAINEGVAISSLQDRGFIITQIEPAGKKNLWNLEISFFEKVSNKDIVILSKQISTLFGAQVSALRVFRLLADESENSVLRKTLKKVADDIQNGSLISEALSRHPKTFSEFYVNMVKSGEETGKLNETFLYLAEHLNRGYELMSKAKNALIYPAFVIIVFIVVMILMFTMVIPKISVILIEAGQELPFLTRVVIFISDLLVNYGLFVLVAVIVGIFFFIKFSRTTAGKISIDRFKLSIPYVGNLYRKMYLARISGNMNTMLSSGISVVKAVETTASVVDSIVYKNILEKAAQSIRTGTSFSNALTGYEEIPNIMVQMIKIGEETGGVGEILNTLSRFYEREVNNAVDMLVGMIEPALIVFLGIGVGGLLLSVLMPIYNISSAI
ncbi:MAG: type II secretion system F family protein [Candidatus Pacebacteria bacterium]|nr:type II secretion system F family protein [Candidatus Paceibacterota bacterium]